MRHAARPILIVLGLAVLFILFGLGTLRQYIRIGDRAGITVQTNVSADVLIDGKALGKTPFEADNLASGEYLVKLSSPQGNWTGYVSVANGTSAIIDRDLEPSVASSSGEIMALDPGAGVLVVSNPTQADVEVDSEPLGQTPLRLNSLPLGEHWFVVRRDGFISRSFRATLKPGFALMLQVDLSLSRPDQAVLPTPAPLGAQMLVVTSTPTGFLRVRQQPSLDSGEIEKVHLGDQLQLIRDLGAWDQVKLADGKEGYAVSEYLQKK